MLRKNKSDKKTVTTIIICLIAACIVVLFIMRRNTGLFRIDKTTGIETDLLENNHGNETAKEDLKAKLMAMYPWDIKVVYKGGDPETFHLSNLIEDDIDRLIDDIYSGRDTSYDLTFAADDDEIAVEIACMREIWDVPMSNSTITGYDSEKNEYLFTEGRVGTTIDAESLKDQIKEAVRNRQFNKTINAEPVTVEPSFTAENITELYSTIGAYTTHSTANENRNNNLRLACEAVNGTILQPGEEFSFNLATGNRTEAKGYREAGAYRDGLHVTEPGGGVCQVASTLYNAAVAAGLKITERHGHTYEPSYVTPGEDATVSYDGYAGPDLRFINNSKSGIAIRASYDNQTVYCSIYGIRILEKNESLGMYSEKTADKGVPYIQYVDDPTLPAGTTVVSSAGSSSTEWKTYLIHYENGIEVSRDLFHTTAYSGNPKIIRQGSAVPVVTEEIPQEEMQTETIIGPHVGPVVGPQITDAVPQVPAIEPQNTSDTEEHPAA